VISESQEGIKAATAKVLKADKPRCPVHGKRKALAHAGKTQRRMVCAAIVTVFVRDSADAARVQWRTVAAQLRGKLPKLGALMDDGENDVLASLSFPRAHWSQICSTNPPSGSMPRSSGAPTSRAASPTRRPSSDWSAP
jgi:putative transposase